MRGESGGGVYGYSLWTYAMQGWSYLGTAGRFDSGDGYGVWASTDGADHWDHGGSFTAEKGCGFHGESTDNYGVRGDGYWGVRGDGQVGGVFGWSSAGDGVRGSSSTGTGVEGASVTGWAGRFTSASGYGVYISAPASNPGLNVASGTKNAVVATNEGSRLLYTEESTAVWFTDYGFGQLESGLAVVTIDSTFAQTANLDEPYHVFVQAYGNAELFVSNRTSTQFEVHLGDGEPGTEFSYRIVAKRLGYADDRLERAPWADNDPNLYPDQTQDGTSAQQPVQGGTQ